MGFGGNDILCFHNGHGNLVNLILIGLLFVPFVCGRFVCNAEGGRKCGVHKRGGCK